MSMEVRSHLAIRLALAARESSRRLFMRSKQGACATVSRRCASAAGWGSPWSSKPPEALFLTVQRGQRSTMTISSQVLDDVVAHARECQPSECCGVLVGQGDRITAAIRARNVAESPSRFLIDPKDHLD